MSGCSRAPRYFNPYPLPRNPRGRGLGLYRRVSPVAARMIRKITEIISLPFRAKRRRKLTREEEKKKKKKKKKPRREEVREAHILDHSVWTVVCVLWCVYCVF